MTLIRDFLSAPVIPGSHPLVCYQVILLIWISGAAYLGAKKTRMYFKMKRLLRLCDKNVPISIWTCIDKVTADFPELKKINVRIAPGDVGPMLFGIREKTLLLPVLDYREEELCMILKHEAMHIRQRDLIWKILADIVSVVFWWNPVFRILRNTLSDMLEINIDLSLMKDASAAQKKRYIECLGHIVGGTSNVDFVGASCFSPQSVNVLKQRLYYIVHGTRETRLRKAFIYLMTGILFFLSSFVLFEARYPAPKGTKSFSDADTYAVYREGKYDIYFNGKYLLTEESMEYYPNVHTIYNEED